MGSPEKVTRNALDLFQEKPHRERYLTKEELPRFLKALDKLDDCPSKAAIKLLLFTGGWKGEITTLRYDQWKPEGKRLFLPGTKNGKSRSIILNDRAIAVLKKNKDTTTKKKDSEYPFPSKNGTKRPHIDALRTPFERTCIAAGIEALRVYDLRHRFATLALQGGASLYDVSKLLGHSDVSMTQRYAHRVDDSLQKATDDMAGVIDRAVSE